VQNNDATLLALLSHYAEAGKKCPTNFELARTLKITSRAVAMRLNRLIIFGHISIAKYPNLRVVTIAATGKSTRPPAPPKARKSAEADKKSGAEYRAELAEAALKEKRNLPDRIARDQAALHKDRLYWLERANEQARRPQRDIYGEMVA
jgi:hypothetical protein